TVDGQLTALTHLSTTSPYTTLFRSPPARDPVCAAARQAAAAGERQSRLPGKPDSRTLPHRSGAALRSRRGCPRPRRSHARLRHRSEEHTSELQSHLNLVCRVLLENK